METQNKETAALATHLTRVMGCSTNFREVGRLCGAKSRRIRKGMLYRSGALDELDQADLAVLGGLGVVLCFDLRSRVERDRQPSRWPPGKVPHTLAFDITSDVRALDRQVMQSLIERPDWEGAKRLMHAIYRGLPESCAQPLSDMFRELALLRAPSAALIHCTGGKDRTGFVMAVLLKALGVSDEDVFADYLESNLHYDAARNDGKIATIMRDLFGTGLDAEALKAISAVRRDYLSAAFGEIEYRWGSVDNYLEVSVGVDQNLRVALQQALLD